MCGVHLPVPHERCNVYVLQTCINKIKTKKQMHNPPKQEAYTEATGIIKQSFILACTGNICPFLWLRQYLFFAYVQPWIQSTFLGLIHHGYKTCLKPVCVCESLNFSISTLRTWLKSCGYKGLGVAIKFPYTCHGLILLCNRNNHSSWHPFVLFPILCSQPKKLLLCFLLL